MKLLIDGDVYSWHRGGGISRIFNELVPLFCRQGVCVEVGVKSGVDPKRIPAEMWPCVRWIPQLPSSLRPWRVWHRVGDVLNPWLVNHYWKRRSGDIFLSSYFTVPPVKAKRVCMVYDMIYEMFPACFDSSSREEIIRLKQNAIMQADAVICISESTKRDVLRLTGVRDLLCSTVYLGGSEIGTRNALDNMHLHPRPFLLYVGDFRCSYKNFAFVLSCLGRDADPRVNGVDLVVVSRVPASDRECAEFATLFPAERLQFVNSCGDEMLAELYSQCEALIYPSKYEGFGLPVVEALACGAPVVCSNAGSLPEVGGEAVHYFEPRSIQQFTDALHCALTERRGSVVTASRKTQAAKFTWRKTADECMNVFREVLLY